MIKNHKTVKLHISEKEVMEEATEAFFSYTNAGHTVNPDHLITQIENISREIFRKTRKYGQMNELDTIIGLTHRLIPRVLWLYAVLCAFKAATPANDTTPPKNTLH